MDPDEALRRLRELIEEARREHGLGFEWSTLVDAAEQFEALDQWLSRGGFLPREWAANR